MALIHEAAHDGNVEEVRRMLEDDPELVHSRDEEEATALHGACDMGHVPVGACLLAYGAHSDAQDDYGITAFYLACRSGHLQLVELLLGHGADPTLSSNGQWTPLIVASFYGRMDVVRCLLENPRALSTLHQRTSVGKTALWCACHKGRTDVVKALLGAGADPLLADNDGVAPMGIARHEGHQGCVDILQEWYRPYVLAKARALCDASPTLHDDVSQPRVEVEGAGAAGGGIGDRAIREADRDLLVEVVLDYVVCAGLRGDLFVELIEMMGTRGAEEELA